MAASRPDRLARYRAKRSAGGTPEPFGGADSGGGRRFVVQMHAARALHYDLRLEMDGVLRSWAVPKGPSPDPADKRLAVQVEDHPLEYAGFEGRIPDGNYGAGVVIVWDRGSWQPIGDPAAGLVAGKLLFDLRGYKLRGRWTLVKTRRGERDWLLIKERDAHVSEAGTDGYPRDSVLSGLTVEDLAADLDASRPILDRLARLGVPRRRVEGRRVKPMLAKSGEAFTRKGWLYEIKLDGYRLICERTHDGARLYSRAGHALTATFPEIAEALSALPFEHVVLDGEAVVHDDSGRPSFARLQRRGRLTRRADIRRAALELPATVYVFDLLGFGDRDLRPLALETRKAILREVLPSVGPLRFSEHVPTAGEQVYEQACRLGLEGMVAKRAQAPYRGGRSADWIKTSAARTDDFAVVGWTPSKGTGRSLGALLLGCYEDDRLVYAGRVGSGLSAADQRSLAGVLECAPALEPLEGDDVPADARWIQPSVVCAVRYKEVTPDGLLRQPVFERLREDKTPRECRREVDVTPPESEPAESEPPDPQSIETEAIGSGARSALALTNLDKVFWPEERFTKGDLVAYYRSVARWLLPYLADRPLVLDRYPDGIHGKSFYQKDAPVYTPDWVRTERMWSEHGGREIRYFVVDDEESLLYVINLGAIPLHVWSSRVRTLERPDWCILDLDPKEAPFAHVVRIARTIHALCTDIGLPCFAKTSGSTGVHVLVPLGARYTYEQSRSLAELLARVVCRELPEIATVTRRPSRRQGKVYVDYLQNGHGRLLVAPLSARPLPGAPVSMPLRWREVGTKLEIASFNLRNAPRRLRSLASDPLRGVLGPDPDLPTALERLARRF